MQKSCAYDFILYYRHGGIMPLIAKHLHKSHIHLVVEHTLHEANMSVNDLNAIAVTVKPGY